MSTRFDPNWRDCCVFTRPRAFSVKERNPKVGRNPRTGDTVAVVAKRVPYFKTGKDLREKLNAARRKGGD
jgi:hypothetical protein